MFAFPAPQHYYSAPQGYHYTPSSYNHYQTIIEEAEQARDMYLRELDYQRRQQQALELDMILLANQLRYRQKIGQLEHALRVEQEVHRLHNNSSKFVQFLPQSSVYKQLNNHHALRPQHFVDQAPTEHHTNVPISAFPSHISSYPRGLHNGVQGSSTPPLKQRSDWEGHGFGQGLKVVFVGFPKENQMTSRNSVPPAHALPIPLKETSAPPSSGSSQNPVTPTTQTPPKTTSDEPLLKDALEARLAHEHEAEIRDIIQIILESFKAHQSPPTSSHSHSSANDKGKGKAIPAFEDNTALVKDPSSSDVARAMDTVASIEASFRVLMEGFEPNSLSNLEFTAPSLYTDVAHDEDSDASTDSTSRLAFTAHNGPIRFYIHSLNGILEQLDAVESYGNEDLRRARKEIVNRVEAALQDIENEVGVRLRLHEAKKRSFKAKDEPEATEIAIETPNGSPVPTSPSSSTTRNAPEAEASADLDDNVLSIPDTQPEPEFETKDVVATIASPPSPTSVIGPVPVSLTENPLTALATATSSLPDEFESAPSAMGMLPLTTDEEGTKGATVEASSTTTTVAEPEELLATDDLFSSPEKQTELFLSNAFADSPAQSKPNQVDDTPHEDLVVVEESHSDWSEVDA